MWQFKEILELLYYDCGSEIRKTSGIFFLGFLLSKLQYLPFPLVSAIFRFLSLGIYSLAYGSWSIACLLHPDHKEHHHKWYGFAQIKEQFLFSSFIGLIATGLSVAAVLYPFSFHQQLGFSLLVMCFGPLVNTIN